MKIKDETDIDDMPSGYHINLFPGFVDDEKISSYFRLEKKARRNTEKKQSLLPDETFCKRLVALENNVKKNIYGQDEQVKKCCNTIKHSYLFRKKNRCLAVFYFCGQTGTGKTQLALEIGRHLKFHIYRVNLAKFSEDHSHATLVGPPLGYKGYEEGGKLTNFVFKYPRSLIVLDEIDKCHLNTQMLFLEVWDTGTLTDTKGMVVDFSNTIFIITSNGGASQIGKRLIGYGNPVIDNSSLDQDVQNRFPQEFRSRIDLVIKFNHLTEDALRLIILRELKEIKTQLAKSELFLAVDEKCVIMLAQDANKEEGARSIRKILKKNIFSLMDNTYLNGASITDQLLLGKIPKGTMIKVIWDDLNGYRMNTN